MPNDDELPPYPNIYRNWMDLAVERADSGDFAGAGRAVGSAWTLAAIITSSDPNDPEVWERRREWATACSDALTDLQSGLIDSDVGTLQMTVGPPITERLVALASRWSTSPQAVGIRAFELVFEAAEAIEDGHDVVLRGPGLQAAVVPEGVNLPAQQQVLFDDEGETDDQ